PTRNATARVVQPRLVVSDLPRELDGGDLVQPSRGELNGQWQTIELPNDVANRGRVLQGQRKVRAIATRAIEQQPHRVALRQLVRRRRRGRQIKRTDVVHSLAFNAQRASAGY